jgi:hypothetical protein
VEVGEGAHLPLASCVWRLFRARALVAVLMLTTAVLMMCRRTPSALRLRPTSNHPEPLLLALRAPYLHPNAAFLSARLLCGAPSSLVSVGGRVVAGAGFAAVVSPLQEGLTSVPSFLSCAPAVPRIQRTLPTNRQEVAFESVNKQERRFE